MEHKDDVCDCEGKVCTICQKLRCIDFFYTYKDRKGELKTRGQCKVCIKEYNHAWRKENPDRARASRAKWRNNNKEKHCEYNIQWRKRNPHYDKNRYRTHPRHLSPSQKERSRSYQRIYARKHYVDHYVKNGISKSNWQKWQHDNPEKHRSYAIRARYLRRSQVRSAEGSYTSLEWQRLIEKYNYSCLCCGKAEPEIKLTADHIVPIALGGANFIENIQPLCKSCNSRKGKKHIDFRLK